MDTKEKMGQPNRRRRPPARTEKPGPRDPKRDGRGASRQVQDITYIPPKPLIVSGVVLHLATVAAVVIALVLAMAVFFRVEHIQVSGMEQYSAWDISQASGIEKNDSLFSLEMIGAAARIQEKLPYVKDVRIGIRLPNMVIIEVTEVRVTYCIADGSDNWWLVDSSGRIIDAAQGETIEKSTKILGFKLANPKKGEQATALEKEEPELDEQGNPIPVTVTEAKRLSVALDIAKYLEANGIIGQAASIDVSNLGDIQFWYGQQYQVKLGDETDLSHKISLIKGAINQLSGETHNSGVLEIFLNDKANQEDDEVKYTRFQ